MSVQPTSNLSHLTTLVSKDNRFRFILYFVAVTILASALSLYPVSILQKVLSSVYPSNPIQPSLPGSLGLLDMLSNEGWINQFGLLQGVATQTIFGTFMGILQWSVLRQYFSRGNWILATILGYQIAGLLTSNPSNPAIYYSVVCQGFFQWLILRQIVRDSWIWLLTYPLASFLANVLESLLLQNLSGSWVIYSILLAILQTIVFCIFYPRSNQTISR